MKSVNFTFLGDESIAAQFGKKGTASDITIYDRKDSDIIRTWAVPTGFPEKIQPLLQAINMGEYMILHVSKLDMFTGEQVIALDMLRKDKGILCHSYEIDRNSLLSMVKGTVVEGYKIVETGELKKEVESLQPIVNEGDVKIFIDHCFDVKGVGTVVLGKVERGTVRQYDNMKLFPEGKDVLIKSIQMHDDTVPAASAKGRVGLAVKGITPDDVQRGHVLAMQDSLKVSSDISLDYKPNKYFREQVGEGQTFIANIGLQSRAAKMVSIDPMKLSFANPVVTDKEDVCIVLKPESKTMRIVGSGKVL